MSADSEPTYTSDQVAVAANALRRAAGLAHEQFPQAQVVAMLSDEIRLLRERGFKDDEISSIIADAGAPIGADAIARHFIDTSNVKREA